MPSSRALSAGHEVLWRCHRDRMIDAPSPLAFFDELRWLDGRALLETIEPYRRNMFEAVLYTFDGDRPRYNLAVCGRAKRIGRPAT